MCSGDRRKELERSITRLTRMVKGIKGDIEVLRGLRDDSTRLARRIERVNQNESSKYLELAGFYSDRIKGKLDDLKEVEVSLAYERDAYTRLTTTI